MKTKEELKNTYIEINGNEKLSKAVQERLFEMGYEWYKNGKTLLNTMKYINMEKDFKITHDDFIIKHHIQIFPSDLGLTDDGEELVSTIEKEPVYGDEVWGRGRESKIWYKNISIGMINNKCAILFNEALYKLEQGFFCSVVLCDEWRTTDPASDKTTLKLTLKEIAEKYGVDEVIINE